MTMQKQKIVSVLIPAFNEEDNVEKAYAAVVETFNGLPDYDFEIVFTDNHSTDRTFGLLQQIAEKDARVRVIRFSRNFGYSQSLLMAYKNASGDCSVQIDCDLQDPPSLIPDMLKHWENGHQVVYGVRRSLQDGPLVAAARRVFYRLISALSEHDLPTDAGEFRLVDRVILDLLRDVDDTSPYLRGLISSMGFSQIGFAYDRQARTAGESKFPFRAMLGLAVDGVLNHSLIPLRIASLTSLAIGAITFFIFFGYLVGRIFFGQDWPAGFATTTVLLLLSIMLNAMFLGVIGEYLGRIFMQSKKRPMPIIQSTLNVDRPIEYICAPQHTHNSAEPR